jgi:HlyD family secretion protein
MSKKTIVIAITALLVFGLGGAFVYQRLAARRSSATVPAETAIVTRGPIRLAMDATGSLVPHAKVALAFSLSGRVAEVLVEEGRTVEVGQPLVRLETDDLQLQLAQAEANLTQMQAGPRSEDIAAAEAALRSAQAGYEKVAAGARAEDVAAAEATLRSARANYDKLESSPRPEEVTMAQADLEKTVAAVRRAQADYDKVASRADIAALPQALALEQATQDYEKAQAAYELKVKGPTAEELVVTQAQVDQARAQLEKLENSPTPAELAAAQAQIDQAQAQLEKLKNGPTSEELGVAQIQVKQARLHLEQATLTAPMAGTVTALHVQPGEWIGIGQPVAVLSDLATLEVKVNLDETDVARIARGAPVAITIDAFPGAELSGKVTDIALSANVQSGVVLYPVTVCLDPTDPSTGSGQALPLRSEMTANVTIIVEERENTLIVPFRAVETEGGQAYVTLKTDAGDQRVLVTLGLITDTQIEILSGVSEGDVVAVYANPVQDTSVMSNSMFGRGQ